MWPLECDVLTWKLLQKATVLSYAAPQGADPLQGRIAKRLVGTLQ